MRSNSSALLSCFTGFLTTVLVIFILLNHSYNEFEDDYKRKADLLFNSTYDMLLQHKIMLNALRSLFNASAIVTPEEFNIFSEELLKIKSAVAFTLDGQNQLKYVSDPVFETDILKGEFKESSDEVLYEIEGYSSVIVRIDEPNMPYLVYAISHKRVQQRLNTHKGVCAQLTLNNTSFQNDYCTDTQASWASALFYYRGSNVVKIPEYHQEYMLDVWYVAPSREAYEVGLLVLLIAAMGFSLSTLMYLKVRNHLRLAQLTIETNSKLALLSSINHEIRTPINAVLGYSQMLKDSDYCDETGRDTLDKIIWSANLLNSVAENTLNFSKAEAGHLTLDNSEVNLCNELHSIDDYYKAFSQTHEKQLVMTIHGNVPALIGLDKTKFFQLTTNFINNAFKYSSGREVLFDISLKCVAGVHFVRVGIKDFGKGMSLESKKAITQPFNTDPNVKTSSQSGIGIGIGLYTCKKVIEDVGGSIRIRSQENRGTLILFRFPYKPISGVPNGLAPIATVSSSDKNKSMHLNPESITRESLLLVDDNRFNLEVCGNILEKKGFNVTTMLDGEAALAEFYVSQPEIVIMDYRLDNSDGVTMIGKMQKLQTSKVHYFILSANDKSEILNADRYPEITYLQKPLNIDLFMQLLNMKKKLD